MTTVLILQGPPGSGKTTYLDGISTTCRVFAVSADDYFKQPDGSWKFDPTKLHEAHLQCFTRFLELCWGDLAPGTLLVVDNTNISSWEYAPYVRVAQALLDDPIIKLITFRRSLQACLAQGKHGVPARIVRDMERRLLTEPQQVPGIEQELIFVPD